MSKIKEVKKTAEWADSNAGDVKLDLDEVRERIDSLKPKEEDDEDV